MRARGSVGRGQKEKRERWENTPAQCSTRFDTRQDGRMGPAVVISVVRHSRSRLRKKERYESLQLEEYRWDKRNPHQHQMVSETCLDSFISTGELAGRCVVRFRAPIFKPAAQRFGIRGPSANPSANPSAMGVPRTIETPWNLFD